MTRQRPHFRSKELNACQVRQMASLQYICRVDDNALAAVYNLPVPMIANARSRLAWLRQQNYLAKVASSEPSLGTIYESQAGILALLISTRRAPDQTLREKMHQWCCTHNV